LEQINKKEIIESDENDLLGQVEEMI